jgi:hypothetical protein
MWGQDMSGVDVVLLQIMPGMLGHNYNLTGIGDGEFFHFALTKLATSLGHLDKKKSGRTVCEIFGAYGWMEGLKLMKWLVDHMLVRGVNYFIPHAYTNKSFPDNDCPPHFNYDQVNPQYRYLPILTKYMNRMCHLLSDGIHVASGLVLYHAEAEWAGDYMPVQKPLRKLMENQLDADVVSIDILAESIIADNQIMINGESYSYLIVPYAEALPKKAIEKFIEIADHGIPVYILDSQPIKTSDEQASSELLKILETTKNIKITKLDNMIEEIDASFTRDIALTTYSPNIRVYHYRRNSSDYYMIFNESPTSNERITLQFFQLKNTVCSSYDAFENILSAHNLRRNDTMRCNELDLSISIYQSILLCFEGNNSEAKSEINSAPSTTQISELYLDNLQRYTIQNNWDLYTSIAGRPDQYKYNFEMKALINLSRPELFPDFSGTFRYKTTFSFSIETKTALLDLGQCYEIAEVVLNGEKLPIKICPPYTFDISSIIKRGENTITVDITNTLVKRHPDHYSAYVKQEPSGLIGQLTYLLFYGDMSGT